MKRILQMPIRNAKGGITQYALRNWALIDREKFIFDWVTLDEKLDFEEELIEQGCKVHHLSCRQEDNLELFEKEMLEILSNDYDAIHLHTSFWRGFLAEELAIKAQIPKIIVHAHSTGIDNQDKGKRLSLLNEHNKWKELFNPDLATHFTTCSDSAAEFLFNNEIFEHKITMLRNGIDTKKFEFDQVKRLELRNELGLNDKFIILQSGRLEYQKNYHFTLEVFKEYSKLNDQAILLIVGDGKLRSEIKELSSTLGDKVRFLGFRTDVNKLLMAADVFLQPSHFEGFSIASIEAQCSGVPWLVSENIKEAALEQYKISLPLIKEEWVNKIHQIYEKPYRNDKAAEELRASKWDIKDSIALLEAIYNE